MLIVGAKGFAKEVLEILIVNKTSKSFVFYDDLNTHENNLLFETYPVLTSPSEAKDYLSTNDSCFTIGIGNPILRKRMFDKFTAMGGKLTSTVSKLATIGTHDVIIGDGNNILPRAVISNSVVIGTGCII